MRKADIDKAWVDCRASRRAVLDVREITTKVGAINRVIRLASRVLAVVGSNGAGKTTWLRQVANVAKGTKENPRKLMEVQSVGGTFRGQLLGLPIAEAPWVHKTVPDTGYIDIAGEVHKFLTYASNLKNFEELLPQAGEKILSNNECAYYQYVVQNNYRKIEIYELELPGSQDEVFPHFVVEVDSKKYDSFSMGFGELCAFYLVWRCVSARKGSILLFDEPDSHLSPRCKVAMINLFAKIAADNNLFILFSSHSAETVTTLQQNEILLISDAGAPEIRFSPEKHVAMRRLGLITRPNVLVLAEDVDAHELLLQTWTKWGGEMNSAIEIQIMLGGAVELARLQRLFPVDARICILQVVLDGDKRNAHPDSPKVLFLPGVEDPVASARSHVTTDPVFFAGQLGVSPEQVHSAIEAIAFADHHDFCSNLSDRLGTQGIDTKRVRSCLFRAWLEEPSIAVQAKKLSERILQLVKLP